MSVGVTCLQASHCGYRHQIYVYRHHIYVYRHHFSFYRRRICLRASHLSTGVTLMAICVTSLSTGVTFVFVNHIYSSPLVLYKGRWIWREVIKHDLHPITQQSGSSYEFEKWNVVMLVSVLLLSPLSRKGHTAIREGSEAYVGTTAEHSCYGDQLRFDRCEFLTIAHLSLSA